MTLRWAFEHLSQPKRKFKMSNVSQVAGERRVQEIVEFQTD